MTKAQAQNIASILKEKFGGKVEFEKLFKSKRYRFAIVSRKFEKMTLLARQDAVWDALTPVLPREVGLDISLIFTYSPKDLATV